jgi:serine/threonine protein kinase
MSNEKGGAAPGNPIAKLADWAQSPSTPVQLPLPVFSLPMDGEVVTSTKTDVTYRIRYLIGEGTFSYVYLATDSWQNDVAIKIIKPNDRAYPAIRDSALNEFLRLLAFRHPNVTYVYDAFEYRGSVYLVTEACSITAEQLIEIPRFDGTIWVRPVARCVLQALHFLHKNLHAHKDIHLGNVLSIFHRNELDIANSQSISFKVADFGISNLIEEINPSSTVMANWIRPPEGFDHAAFGPLDHRADIYHTGLLLLQILVGRKLAYTEAEIMAGAAKELALSLHTPIGDVLAVALRRHAEFRYGSALDFWHAIERAK